MDGEFWMMYEADVDKDCRALLQETVSAMVGPQSLHVHVFRKGVWIVSDEETSLNRVLWDTGALARSYINKEIVNKNREKWKEVLKPYNSVVRLADQNTQVHTTEKVRGVLRFYDDQGAAVEAEVEAIVWDCPGIDFILGLPEIVKHYLDMFVVMLREAENDVNALGSDIDWDAPMWYKGDVEEAPEDIETPEPCSFRGVLAFMEVPYEEALAEYHGMLEDHVGPLLKDCKEMWDILKSELCVRRFVQKEWEGIKGFPPMDIKVRDDFPASMRVRARPVNPKLYENAHKEFLRLCEYIYRPSDSPWNSPLVIAPKATKPFIRLCADYRVLNSYVEMPQAYIPRVQHEIEKAMGFRIFIDLDLTNSYHQWPMTEKASRYMAINTCWGCVEPMFLCEGLNAGGAYLQTMMYKMFHDFEAWTIVIFDNVLILANDQKDAAEKMRLFLERCDSHNVSLKMSKTFIGFNTVKFFGYEISFGKYGMDNKRKEAIMQCTMPTNTKQMQSFLGSALFFKSFVPCFSDVSGPLYEMTKSGFNWDKRTWTKNYEQCFEQLKISLSNSISNYFPDYDLPWVVRCDASDFAVGAVLFQVRTLPDGVERNEPIAFASKKFSDVAFRWDTIKKECYALYWAVRNFEYYLRGKPFLAQTDHKNLLWLDKSEVPILIRWRVFLQSFNMQIQHVAGTKNIVADWLSRMVTYIGDVETVWMLNETHAEISCLVAVMTAEVFVEEVNRLTNTSELESPMQQTCQVHAWEEDPQEGQAPKRWSAEEMFKEVHGGRRFHLGCRRTWLRMNEKFPGHKVHYRQIEDMVDKCSICQKDRIRMSNPLWPVERTLKPEHARTRVGVDNLTITPKDKRGNEHLVVIVDHFTKYVWAYPTGTYDATSVATALFIYFCTFGLYDELISDPGSDLMSEVVVQLSKWFGIKRVISLVNRHESNGVEGSNKQILRHLKTLVHDERRVDTWSDPINLCLVLFVVNDEINSETGVRPIDARFGCVDGPYLRLPSDTLPQEVSKQWIKNISDNLKEIRLASARYMSEVAQERLAVTPAHRQNMYKPGELVLFLRDPDKPLPTKLTPHFAGPYRVIQQVKNDVQCKHLSMMKVETFFVSNLKMFHGSEDDAKKAAMLDADHYLVRVIRAWKGDRERRTSMKFLVEFADNDQVWVRYSQDIADTVQFEEFIMRNPPLFMLRFKLDVAVKERSRLKNSHIIGVDPGLHVYVDLRCWDNSGEWYEGLKLPNAFETVHVVECAYTKWKGRGRYHIMVQCMLFDEEWSWDAYDVFCWGTCREVKDDMTLVDDQFARLHREVLPEATENAPDRRAKILRRLGIND